MSSFGRVVLISLVIVAILTVPAIGSNRSDGCAHCHAGFEPFEVAVTGPAEVPTGSTFEITATVINNRNNDRTDDDDDDGFPYDVLDIQASIDLSTGLSLPADDDGGRDTADLSSGNSATLTWTVVADEAGPGEVTVDIEGTVYYEHSSGAPDQYDYTITDSLQIEIIDVPLKLSFYSINLVEGQARSYDLVLTSNETLENMVLTPSSSIADFIEITSSETDWQDGFDVLPANSSRIVTISVDGRKEISGTIGLVWTSNTSGIGQLNLTITIIGKAEAAGSSVDFFRLAGRASGMVLFGLAFVSIVLGGFPPQVRKRLRKMGAKRIRWHCNISYLILALSIFHAMVLLAGPFGSQPFAGGMRPGWFALIAVTLLAVNGALMKPFIRKLGRRTWRWMHIICSVVFIVTMIVHAVRIGTEFAFLR